MSSRERDTSAARDPLASGASIGSARVDESPRLVTRGETHERDDQAACGAALIDWLAFTVRPPAAQDRKWLEDALATVFCVPREGWLVRARGWFGYTHRLELGAFGFLAFGGAAQRGTLHVSLNGHACAFVRDWNAVRLWGETYRAAITRADAAHDDMEARDIDVQRACDWWRIGKFNTNGRPPKAHLEDDMGLGTGKTFYVGRRASGKLLRVYERGKKLGSSGSLWVRAEVELRNKNRVVPWEVVAKPGQYLAGAYPALRVLCSEQVRVRTTQRAAEISYEAMVRNLRVQGGKSLNVMCKVHQGDAAAVVGRLVREGVPKRLVGIPNQAIAALEESVA
jgi:phage replication initiation protein